MMLQQQGVPGLMGNSGDAAAAAEAREPGGGGGSTEVGAGFNEEEKGRSDESERSSGGNRWPRQETIALLKIRSDMDVAFRDSSLKGPLWDEVSRKLAELGYHRSAKKCKEKFENVYKYHKRTKDGRTTKPDGKAYRFFEQLEALDNTHPQFSVSSSPIKSQLPIASNTLTSAMLGSTTINVSSTTPMVSQFTVSSTPSPISTVYPNNVTPIMHHPTNHPSQPTQPNSTTNATVSSQGISGLPSYNVNLSASLLSNSTSSSSTSSDQEPERYRKRKRKCKDFFGKLMTEVIKKQDALQKKFLDTLEERERDRMIREEAWRAQETAKMNREHDLLAQERSMAAAKDAAIIAFLQKISDQQNLQIPIAPTQLHQIQVQVQENRMAPVQAPPPVVQQHRPPPAPVQAPTPAPVQAPPVPSTAPPIEAPAVKSMDIVPTNNGTDNFMSPSPSRWPKAEVQALIKLRTTLDNKYNESGPKGPLWEEISGMMRKLGYNRNAKRCKEKWENINKYYKKVKESSKKRPEDAKTCPYFHQLEALYKEKNKTEGNSFNPGFNNKPENPTTVPIMVQPEQQWPLTQPHHQQQQQDTTMAENEIEKMGQNDEDDYEDDDEDDEDDGAGYEIVTNKQPSSVATAE